MSGPVVGAQRQPASVAPCDRHVAPRDAGRRLSDVGFGHSPRITQMRVLAHTLHKGEAFPHPGMDDAPVGPKTNASPSMAECF